MSERVTRRCAPWAGDKRRERVEKWKQGRWMRRGVKRVIREAFMALMEARDEMCEDGLEKKVKCIYVKEGDRHDQKQK